jgi:hypothetical protein
MTTALLPRIAADYEGNGLPWYAAAWDHETGDETNVAWLAEPRLIPGYHWATEADAIGTVHIVLDVAAVAELLHHRLDADPDVLDYDAAIDIIDAELVRVRCDMRRCAADCAADTADHYDGGQRYSRCVLAAGRLLGVGV